MIISIHFLLRKTDKINIGFYPISDFFNNSNFTFFNHFYSKNLFYILTNFPLYTNKLGPEMKSTGESILFYR